MSIHRIAGPRPAHALAIGTGGPEPAVRSTLDGWRDDVRGSQFLLALVLNGASIGLMYSLIALGFVLVYKATDAINFAQGEFVMLAGLIVVTVAGLRGRAARSPPS